MNYSFSRKRFGDDLRKKFTETGLTTRDAASQVGVSQPTLIRAMGGNEPSLKTYALCCRWMVVDIKHYFNN